MRTQHNLSEIETEQEWADGLASIEGTIARLFDGIPHHRRAEYADDFMLWARHQSDEGLSRSIEALSAARYSRAAVMDALNISKSRFIRLLGEKPITFDPTRRRADWEDPEDAIDISHLMGA